MPFCSKCGKELIKGNAFCSNCGSEVPKDINIQIENIKQGFSKYKNELVDDRPFLTRSDLESAGQSIAKAGQSIAKTGGEVARHPTVQTAAKATAYGIASFWIIVHIILIFVIILVGYFFV
jgi:hypothetical protein